MATHTLEPRPERLRFQRVGLATGILVGLAILLVTQDPQGWTPYLLIIIALCISVIGYHWSGGRRS